MGLCKRNKRPLREVHLPGFGGGLALARVKEMSQSYWAYGHGPCFIQSTVDMSDGLSNCGNSNLPLFLLV